MIMDNGVVLTAPLASAQVVEFRNRGTTAPVATVQNLSSDTATTLVVKESNNGTTWTDVSGLETTALAAGAMVSLSITSLMTFLAIWANNSVDLKIDLRRHLADVSDLD